MVIVDDDTVVSVVNVVSAVIVGVEIAQQREEFWDDDVLLAGDGNRETFLRHPSPPKDPRRQKDQAGVSALLLSRERKLQSTCTHRRQQQQYGGH
jgi:hypothetical protein